MTAATPEPSAAPERSLLTVLRTEVGAAGLLLLATIVALAWANSPWSSAYHELWGTHVRIGVGRVAIEHALDGWVTDGLMVLFFLVVGLELRRELVFGDLRDWRVAAVPALAAVGGMAVPALLYTAFNAGSPGAHGWGIVMATDIAFVLGAMALLGPRVPPGVRLFLLTLAIVDDIGAIVVIAIFYGDPVALGWLVVAAAILVAIVLLVRRGDARRPGSGLPLLVVGGLVLWIATQQSGVHPTIAGVALGLVVPVRPRPGAEREVTLNSRLQAGVYPVTSLVVVPLFALASAGVTLGDGVISRALASPVTIGVVVGLVVGKLLGVVLFSLGAVRLRIGSLPRGMRRQHALGAGGLAGIGFTVSLFVADLAFADPTLRDEAKIGVLLASLLATAVGGLLLTGLGRRRRDGPGGPKRPHTDPGGPMGDSYPDRH